jgi:prefoldin beta subunit
MEEAELQQKIQQFQSGSQQLQALSQQRQQMDLIAAENARALEALEGMADDGTVFRTVGSLLLQDNVVEARERLTGDNETMEIRVKRLKAQEATMQESLTALQAELQKALA